MFYFSFFGFTPGTVDPWHCMSKKEKKLPGGSFLPIPQFRFAWWSRVFDEIT
jgi:hypothetical protein